MPGNVINTPPLATEPVPKNGTSFDIIVIGAGVVGTAFAVTFGKQGKRIILVERDLSEPDRIVGELLQPGGCQALRELGLEDCLEGIDAVRTYGYGVLRGSEEVHIPYTTDPETGKPFEGRSFHHGRFIQKLRAAASQAPNVTVVEATVNDILRDEDGIRATGVSCVLKSHSSTAVVSCPFAKMAKEAAANKSFDAHSTDEQEQELQLPVGHAPVIGTMTRTEFLAPLVVVADGCFSKFRKQFIQKPVKVASHFVGLVLKDITLPFPNHGHVILATPSPILMYPISSTETRLLIDIPGKTLPSSSSGALQSLLHTTILPQLPSTIQPAFQKALDSKQDRVLRSMPNSILHPTNCQELGVILLGDAMNMRHPLTGGGMTVGLKDVVYLREFLKGDVTEDQEVTMVQMALFSAKRKELAGVMNVLALALYTLFSGQDKNFSILRKGCFSYFQKGGEAIQGPISLLSGVNPSPWTLIYHFYSVAFHSIGLLFSESLGSLMEYPALMMTALSVFWTACVVFLPVIWKEM